MSIGLCRLISVTVNLMYFYGFYDAGYKFLGFYTGQGWVIRVYNHPGFMFGLSLVYHPTHEFQFFYFFFILNH